MIEKYHNCKKELKSTQIPCEKWVELCTSYEILMEKQIKSNVKFGVGFRKHDNYPYSTENTHIESQMLKKLAEIELMVGGFLWLRLRATVRRIDGEPTTFWRRLENLSLL
ncbi:hypothetical protein Hanom_Chr07g00634841 [Helianthus anomalus]